MWWTVWWMLVVQTAAAHAQLMPTHASPTQQKSANQPPTLAWMLSWMLVVQMEVKKSSISWVRKCMGT